jgi:hypothetical protein
MLGRPHRVAPLLESIADVTTVPYRVLFVCTPGDTAVIEAIDAEHGEHITVERQPTGDYARKINAGYRYTNEPLLFLGADDLRFHPHWFERAVAHLDDPAIGVVGTNDLTNRRTYQGTHSTHSLVTRRYADRFGTIDEPGKVLYEGYVHEYVDDELVGTAQARGAYAHAIDSVVEHLHPMGGKAPTDDLYDAQAERMRLSRRVFQKRRAMWMSPSSSQRMAMRRGRG